MLVELNWNCGKIFFFFFLISCLPLKVHLQQFYFFLWQLKFLIWSTLSLSLSLSLSLMHNFKVHRKLSTILLFIPFNKIVELYFYSNIYDMVEFHNITLLVNLIRIKQNLFALITHLHNFLNSRFKNTWRYYHIQIIFQHWNFTLTKNENFSLIVNFVACIC